MALFIKTKETNILSALEKEKAMEIYELLKTKDANTLFLEDNIPTEYTKQVEKELKRLESEMVSKMNGSFELTAKIPAEFDEEGIETKAEVPATYYIVTTETALKESMSSDIIDIPTLVTDIRVWSDGNPDVLPTWTAYKASFN